MKPSESFSFILIWILFLAFTILISCGAPPANPKDAPQQVKVELDPKYCGYHEMQFALNKMNTTANGNSWTLVLSSECNCKIQWTSNEVTRQTNVEFDFYTARHFYCEWENDDFIVLRAHHGSDIWLELFLPVDESKEEFVIENPFAHDSESNLVVFENLKGDNRYQDTVMRVVHLKTKKEQQIIEKSEKCVSALNHYCIDSVSIANGILNYRWINLDVIGADNFKQRHIKLKKLN